MFTWFLYYIIYLPVINYICKSKPPFFLTPFSLKLCKHGQHKARSTALHCWLNGIHSAKKIQLKIQETYGVSTRILHTNMRRHMKKKRYKNAIPLATPILTSNHIDVRKAWAQYTINTLPTTIQCDVFVRE